MKWACLALLAACAAFPLACSSPSVRSVETPEPSASAPAPSAVASSVGAVSPPTLVFALAAPNSNAAHLPVGSPVQASDYTVVLTGDHVISARFHTFRTIGGSGSEMGALDIALDATGTATMAKWTNDHRRSLMIVLVGDRLLGQPFLAKAIKNGRLVLIGTDVAAMSHLVDSAIRAP